MNMTRIPQAITSKFQTSRASDGETSSVKIENCVGFTRVPLGVAGPLQVQGSDGTTGSFYGPLATCEATLIASCSRGCKALNMCQGVRFKILQDSMSRAPAFWFANTEDAVAFFDLVPSLQPKFKKDAESTSNMYVCGLLYHILLVRVCMFVLNIYVEMLLDRIWSLLRLNASVIASPRRPRLMLYDCRESPPKIK